MPERPLSPHLSVYRFMHTMALSILHRIAGVWMAVCLSVLVYWLASAAAGESEYDQASAVLNNLLKEISRRPLKAITGVKPPVLAPVNAASSGQTTATKSGRP